MNDTERRGAQRVTLATCGEAEQEANLSGMVHDLSSSGMAFIAEKPFAAGDSLKVGFTLGDLEGGTQHPVETEVEVVRCEALEQGGYRIGTRFTDLDGEGAEHLRGYLEDLLVLI